MLFYGPSGTGWGRVFWFFDAMEKKTIILLLPTGKTMTANAVAKHLNKKILLVTVSLLNETQITKVKICRIVMMGCDYK